MYASFVPHGIQGCLLWITTDPRLLKRQKCAWCLFHQTVHTENSHMHAYIHGRQVAHGSSSPTGASVTVVQHQFMLQVSDSKAQPTRSVHTNTQLSTLELHCVIPLFGYVSLSGPPPPLCLYHTKQHKGKDKNSFWPQRSQSYHISFVWRLCWCCFELLKEMWNYLTKAWEEGA